MDSAMETGTKSTVCTNKEMLSQLSKVNAPHFLPTVSNPNYKAISKPRRGRRIHFSFSDGKLLESVLYNNVDHARHILEQGANPNCFDCKLRAPIHLAVTRGYTDIVKLLLENGANPNQQDLKGNTPLHLAACTNNISIVNLLLKAGADVCLRDDEGRNPLQLAERKLKLFQSYCNSIQLSQEIKGQICQIIRMLMEMKSHRGLDVDTELCALSGLSLNDSNENTGQQIQNILDKCESLSLNDSDNECKKAKGLLSNVICGGVVLGSFAPEAAGTNAHVNFGSNELPEGFDHERRFNPLRRLGGRPY